MRHAYTLFLLGWGAVMILVAIVQLMKGRSFADVLAPVVMGLIGFALAVGVWIFTGSLVERGRPPAAVTSPQQGGVSSQRPAETSAALALRMTRHVVTALAVWLLVLVLISAAGMVLLHDAKYAQTTGLVRFGTLFWKAFLVLLAIELVLWLANPTWINDQPGPGSFSKALNIAFAALPVIVGLLGLLSLFKGRDPWEYLPGGPPFALREFAARHPRLHVETVGALGGDVVEVSSLSSPWPRAVYSEQELRDAMMTWDTCADAGAPARLGGPPPYPGSRCLLRIEIRRPDYDALTDDELDRDVEPPDMKTTRYVYSIGREYFSKVMRHFVEWAKTMGPEPNVYGNSIEVTARGKIWTIEARDRKNIVGDVYIDYTERRPPAAGKNE